MSYDYTQDRADAAEAIAEAGFAMTLTRPGAGIFDPVSGTTTGGVSQSWDVYGMKSKLGNITRYGENTTILGTTIEAGDQLMTIEAGIVTPLPGDTLTIDGVVWRVLASNGAGPTIDLFYSVHARR